MGKIKQLMEAAEPLMKFLKENYNPHTKVIVDCISAELLEGIVYGIECDEEKKGE